MIRVMSSNTGSAIVLCWLTISSLIGLGSAFDLKRHTSSTISSNMPQRPHCQQSSDTSTAPKTSSLTQSKDGTTICSRRHAWKRAAGRLSTVATTLLLARQIVAPTVVVAAAATDAIIDTTGTTTSTTTSLDASSRSDSDTMSIDVDRRVSKFLSNVPTFSIVDAEGVPYMVVGEDAKVTGYFFTSYTEAQRILQAATTATDRAMQQERKERQSKPQSRNDPTIDDPNSNVNPWKAARISTVPLETAVALALSAVTTTKGNYFRLAPSEDDVQDALAASSSTATELPEGKVPLFYYADFNLTAAEATVTNPLYFSRKQLEAAYRKARPREKQLPDVQVTELFAILSAMAKSGGSDSNNDEKLQTTPTEATNSNDLGSLVLIAPPESAKRAAECRKRGGTAPPLVLGQRNLIL
jgi:Tic22-like family